MTATLSVTEVLSWGALFYTFAVVAPELHARWSAAEVSGALTVGLLVSGLAAPRVAAALLTHGPRLTMALGSLIGASGMLAWAAATSLAGLYAAWALIGVAMAATFYEPATATLVALHGAAARRAIVTVTAAGGLASTVVAPSVGFLAYAHGWRATVAGVGVAAGLLTAALHAAVLPGPLAERVGRPCPGRVPDAARRALSRLRVAVALEQVGHVVVATFLVGLLVSRGHPPAHAGLALASVGVGKAAGRLLLAGPIGALRPVPAATTAAGAQGLLLSVPLLTERMPVVVAAAAGLGAAAGALTVLRPLITMEIADRASFAAASARLHRAALAGRVSGPLVFGLAVDGAGWSASWAALTVAFAATALAYRLADRRVREAAGRHGDGWRPVARRGAGSPGGTD